MFYISLNGITNDKLHNINTTNQLHKVFRLIKYKNINLLLYIYLIY
jgi:hypothetical protein